MPELPEVETIKLGLADSLVGQSIKGAKVLWAKSFNVPNKVVQAQLIGAKISGIRRRGKVLIIDLNNKFSLLIHLKMTGQLIYDQQTPKLKSQTTNKLQKINSKNLKIDAWNLKFADRRFAGGHPTKSMAGELPDNSTRVIFKLSGGTLYFNDQRKFGWVKLVPDTEVELDSLIARMGPEPLKAGFEISDFRKRVSQRKTPIKAVLLDQSVVAGLGNIYVDEALHLAKIHPLTPASKINKVKLAALQTAIIKVLKDSLSYGGTSFTNYVNHLGVNGNYLDFARVFRKTGQPCPVCGTAIVKLRVAGRGTHICPNCQKLSANKKSSM